MCHYNINKKIDGCSIFILMELAFILKGLENADDILLLELLNKLDQITSSRSSRKSIDDYRQEVIDNQKLIQKSTNLAAIDRKDSVNSIKSWADSVEEYSVEDEERENEELRQKMLKEETEKKAKLSLADIIKTSPVPVQIEPVVVKSPPKSKTAKKTQFTIHCEICKQDVEQLNRHTCSSLNGSLCKICNKRFHLHNKSDGELIAIIIDKKGTAILQENGEFTYHYLHNNEDDE